MKKILLSATILVASLTSFAQVGIGTATPAASAALELSSTSKGFLPPRMTEAQRNSIVSPEAGLMVYCSNCGTYGEPQYYNGTAWVNMVGGTASAGILLTVATTALSAITTTSASSGVTILHTGGSAVSESGVVWSTSTQPTIALSTKTTGGSGAITGLSSATTYYVRAYAINAFNTSYGDEIIFSTLSPTNYTLTFETDTYPSSPNGITWSTDGVWNSIRDYGQPRNGSGAVMFVASNREFILNSSVPIKLNHFYLKKDGYDNNATSITIKVYDGSNTQIGSTNTFTNLSDWNYIKYDLNLSGVRKIVITNNATGQDHGSGYVEYMGYFWLDDLNYDY